VRILLICIHLFLFCCTEIFAVDFVCSPVQLECIKTKAFQEYLDVKVPAVKISASGGIGRNLHSFSDVAAQRSALLLIFHGILRDDRKTLDNGVKALAMPFEFQKTDGTFECPSRGNRQVGPGDIYGESVFVGAVGEAVLILKNTKYADEYLPRILKNQNQIKKWLSYFVSIKDQVLAADLNFGNRLAYDVLALQSFGVIFNDMVLLDVAEKFILEIVRMQDAKGYYPDNGGPDSSYNAVTAWKMQVCSIYAPENLKADMMSSIRKSMQWEIAKIDPQTGMVNVDENIRTGKGQEKFLGRIKDVNYEEVAYSLFYWEPLGESNSAGDMGRKIISYARAKYGR